MERNALRNEQRNRNKLGKIKTKIKWKIVKRFYGIGFENGRQIEEENKSKPNKPLYFHLIDLT